MSGSGEALTVNFLHEAGRAGKIRWSFGFHRECNDVMYVSVSTWAVVDGARAARWRRRGESKGSRQR